MRIGILGAGDMADALGTQWARAGHELMVSGRDAAKAADLARRIAAAATPADALVRDDALVQDDGVVHGGEVVHGGGVVQRDGGARFDRRVALDSRVRAGSWAEAAEFGEVVVVAVRAEGLSDVLQAAGPALRGKPVVDVTNRPFDQYDPARPLAETIADLTGGHVVKAFNLCHVDVWRMTPPVFDGRPLAVPLCGDDPAALEATRRLVADLGCTPVHGGGLGRATLLEATAAFVIGLWVGGTDAQAILPPWETSGAHPAS